MHSAFNLLFILNSMFISFLEMKGLCALRRNSTSNIIIAFIIIIIINLVFLAITQKYNKRSTNHDIMYPFTMKFFIVSDNLFVVLYIM